MNSRVLKVTGNLLIGLIILACLPVAVPKLLGLQTYNVISGSMEPSISVGSIVYVKNAEFDELAEGDVIAFESGASVVTHRITSIDSQSKLITTKGDANDTEDFVPVAYVNVIGRVVAHVPFLGYIASWLSEITGKVIAVMLLIIGLLLSNSGDKSQDKEKAENKKQNTKVNPKVFLALGLVIIVGSMSGFLYIFMDYQSSNSLYSELNSSYININEQVSDDSWDSMIDVDFESLQQINPDVVAWIYVEGTDISYPILYSGDDETYLRTTMEGESAKAGSIFLEGYNYPDFTDSHSIIYGHNMRNLSMFGTLKYYKSEEGYLDEHRYFQIITPDSKMRYEIFSYFDTEAASWVYAVPYSDCEEFDDYISELLRHSYEVVDTEEVTSADRVVTLSTCSTSGMRFTVHGVLRENISL
ncbi:sortase B [Pseudobutyrivibrio sp. JW11]|uniref:class B sortase n=1 Tax=Pseudobutyrivibrio sp. JW11 TaxID=1855302 RepID=UPI0008ECFD3B|nr:class B sortase [Pseudobutyrivibrio sp. JW11]SFO16885.1 sortase B [Pseudobutyrivibrio sp. JW11]